MAEAVGDRSPTGARWALVGVALAVTVVVAAVFALVAACGSIHGKAVPPALVGRWKGGEHGNGPWYYEFSDHGDYRTWPERTPEAINTGTVEVDETTITFSNGGAPVTSSWLIADDRLLLDGAAYVRA